MLIPNFLLREDNHRHPLVLKNSNNQASFTKIRVVDQLYQEIWKNRQIHQTDPLNFTLSMSS